MGSSGKTSKAAIKVKRSGSCVASLDAIKHSRSQVELSKVEAKVRVKTQEAIRNESGKVLRQRLKCAEVRSRLATVD